MKKFFKLFKSELDPSVTCSYHMETNSRYLRPLEYCNTCSLSICYACGNNHMDKYCNVEWGLEIFDSAPSNLSPKNERFNLGYPFLINLTELKCPCGTAFLSKMTSTLCSACGVATCSKECHDKYAQKENKCKFHKNFVANEDTVHFQGLRLTKITDIIKLMKMDIPPFNPISMSSSKFLKVMMSPFPFGLILQRGFRQYGEPHEATLEAMTEYTEAHDKDIMLTNKEHMTSGNTAEDLFKHFSTKLCTCQCNACRNRSPHPEFNCFRDCEHAEELTEQEKLSLGLYKRCQCICQHCATLDVGHRVDDCIKFCSTKKIRH